MTLDSPRPSFFNHLWYLIGRLAERLTGWRAVGILPPEPKYVIVGQHTSNWDFVIGLLAMCVLSHGMTGMHFCWLGKRELFWPPLGWLLRRLGGIPVDRSAAHDLVNQSVEAFRQHERMVMIVTPEGTRKRSRRWKTGFYYIALGAGVPILCARLDAVHKTVGPGLLLWATGNFAADMCRIRDFYQGMQPLFPDQAGEIYSPCED